MPNLSAARGALTSGYGFRNPFAAVWGVVDRDDILWLTGEHFCRNKPLRCHIKHSSGQSLLVGLDSSLPPKMSALTILTFRKHGPVDLGIPWPSFHFSGRMVQAQPGSRLNSIAPNAPGPTILG